MPTETQTQKQTVKLLKDEIEMLTQQLSAKTEELAAVNRQAAACSKILQQNADEKRSLISLLDTYKRENEWLKNSNAQLTQANCRMQENLRIILSQQQTGNQGTIAVRSDLDEIKQMVSNIMVMLF